MLYSCYVRGCHDDSTVGRIHKQFGRVDCCPGHDPARFGQAFGMFVTPNDESDQEPTPAGRQPQQMSKDELIAAMFTELLRLAKGDDNPDGGKKAKLRKPVKPLPPNGAAVSTMVQ